MFVRASSSSPKYWTPSTIWRFLSELVLLLINSDCLQQFEDFVRACSPSTKYWQLSTIWRFCQSLFYFYQILTAFNNLEIVVRDCSSSTKFWQLSTIWRFCQSLFYFYQILTAFNNLKILSELVLLLLNTDRLQQFEDFVRACSTSTKYWPLSTIWRFCQSLFHFYQILTVFNNLKILSELVLLLLNTDSFQQFEDFSQCLFYFS
jgi:hypothetical protein